MAMLVLASCGTWQGTDCNQDKKLPAKVKRLIRIKHDVTAPLLTIFLDTIYKKGDIIELGGEQYGNYIVYGTDTSQTGLYLTNNYLIVR